MPNAKEVADYLERHPDFFAARGALLASMRLPEEFATPFHARQAQAMRERQARLDRMLETLKTNQNLEQELHELAVELLRAGGAGADDSAADVSVPAELLKARFDLTAVAIFLESRAGDFEPGVDYASLCARVSHFSGACDDRVSSKLSAALFPPPADAGAIASCAFVPLLRAGAAGEKRCLRGVMVLGDADRARFQPGMGALILDRLGQQVSAFLCGRGLL